MNQKETNNRDYSLLREFNLEQAQAGDEIVFFIDYLPPMGVAFKGCTSDQKMVFVEYKHIYGINGKSYYKEELKMKPLAWLEGKPVYKGDVLHEKSPWSGENIPLIVMSTFEPLNRKSALKFTSGTWADTDELTWDKPKEPKQKSGWINIWKCSSAIGVSTGSQIYLSKEDALTGLLGQWDMVDTVEITWME